MQDTHACGCSTKHHANIEVPSMFTWRVANLDLASKQISSFLACLTWWNMYSQHGAILEESTKTVSEPMIGILSKLQNDNAARYTFRASKLWPDCKGVNEYHSYCTQASKRSALHCGVPGALERNFPNVRSLG